MSKKEKDVELIPSSSEASGWKVKHDLKEGVGPGPQNYPKVKFDFDSGPHLIVFTLPKTPANVTFDPNDPIAIKEGTTSPAVGSGIDPQFPDWAIFDGGKTLVVLDRNSGPAKQFAYTIKAKNYDPVLDPIVDNGGGVGGVIDPPGIAPDGGGYSESQYIAAAAIALLVGILVGFFVHKFFFAPKLP